MTNKDYKKFLENLLILTVEKDASDLHLSWNRKPILRIDGSLASIDQEKTLNITDIQEMIKIMLTQERFEKFLKERDIDFSYGLEEIGRFRGNAYFHEGVVSCSLRFVPKQIRTIEELRLPPILHTFSSARQGFVLVTGPSSHGKSTTLAALIDEINHTRRDHIITIEDPIEYIFEDDLSIIDQREVLEDTLSFARALRATFRQDPDVIMVGEMRDPETIAAAITAAETGHLVFATLHTNSAAQTIHRILDTFDGHKQNQIQSQLSGSLLGIISQRLVPKISGGLVPAVEIIFNNAAISNLIRENKIHEIPVVIETSSEGGMISLNRALANLVESKEVSREDAFRFSNNAEGLKILLGRSYY